MQGAQHKLNKSQWIADGQRSETKQRCSTFTLLRFNSLFDSVEVNGSVCYTAPSHWLPHPVRHCIQYKRLVKVTFSQSHCGQSDIKYIKCKKNTEHLANYFSSRLQGQTEGCIKKKVCNEGKEKRMKGIKREKQEEVQL